MARIGLILGALGRITVRELRHLNAIIGNNFFIFALLFLSQSGAFLHLLIGLLLLFPLTANPLERIPATRLSLWPISTRERFLLRLASYAISPAMVATLVGVAFTQGSTTALRFFGLVVVVTATTAALRGLSFRTPRLIPGHAGLIGVTIRQLVSMLDFYLALALTLVVIAYRAFAAEADASAIFVMTLMIVLAMSSAMQCAFARELPGGWTRYALWPVRGWRVLLAKDLGMLLLLLPMLLPLAPLAGLGAALAALAIGHHRSVTVPHPQPKWRFYAGTIFPHGMFQTVAIFGTGALIERESIWFVAVAGGLFVASLFFYGWVLELRLRDNG